MKRITAFLPALCLGVFICLQATAQKLPARWDEITAADWNNALAKSNKTCILPIGILEKHGPHVPMGSDLIRVREYASRATQKEYAVVFPDYFYGQINEAKHQPGVFSLPERVVWNLLENTCDEIARNGFNKIIIVNGHGGNPELIKYFIQTRLEKERNYAVYFFQPSSNPAFNKEVSALRRSNAEGDKASVALGKLVADHTISQLIDAIKAIKSDEKTLVLQKEFFNRVRK